MKYEIIQDRCNPEDWRVEAIAHAPEGDGAFYIAIFCGIGTKERAEEYIAWKSQLAVA